MEFCAFLWPIILNMHDSNRILCERLREERTAFLPKR